MSKKRKKQQDNIVTVGFIALGCPKNLVDSEKMLADIAQAGFVISQDISAADAVIINTCGFIAPAREEALDAINEAIGYKQTGNVKKVIVTGCLVQRMGALLSKQAPGIDAIAGLGQRDRIAEIISSTLNPESAAQSMYMGGSDSAVSDDRGRMLITPVHWAYLRISEGCNRRCAFCTIPSIRGKFRSKPADMIISEACELTANGAVELSIIAQDSNYYGRDRGENNGLANLIPALEKINGLEWIRLMYLYPAGIDDTLIETIAASQKVINYIDMPIQHINDQILKSMRRADRKHKTIELIEKLRTAMPDVILRTTVITGLPGETEESFAELMEFIEWAKFDALGCFKFFPEQDTAAADMDGQVPADVALARADKLMAVQQKIAFDKAVDRIGSRLTCLVDEPVAENEVTTGRFYGQAPHIDSICLIENCRANPGDMIETEVTGTSDYDLVVKPV